MSHANAAVHKADLDNSTAVLVLHRAQQLVGLAVVMVVPAVFWTIVLSLAGPWAGLQLAMTGLMLTGLSISMFLGVVCAPIMLRADA